MFKMSRPLSAGGSGLELVGIKEPELPPVSFDVCCHFYVEFVLMSFLVNYNRIPRLFYNAMRSHFQYVGKKTEEACQKYEE